MLHAQLQAQRSPQKPRPQRSLRQHHLERMQASQPPGQRPSGVFYPDREPVPRERAPQLPGILEVGAGQPRPQHRGRQRPIKLDTPFASAQRGHGPHHPQRMASIPEQHAAAGARPARQAWHRETMGCTASSARPAEIAEAGADVLGQALPASRQEAGAGPSSPEVDKLHSSTLVQSQSARIHICAAGVAVYFIVVSFSS